VASLYHWGRKQEGRGEKSIREKRGRGRRIGGDVRRGKERK